MNIVSVGDILQLDKGFDAICEEIPKVYFKGHQPYSTKLTNGCITVGEARPTRCSEDSLRQELTKIITFAFAYYEVPLDKSILVRFINHQIPTRKIGPFCIPGDWYVVTSVKGDGNRKQVRCGSYNPKPGQPVYRIYFSSDRGIFENNRWGRIVGNVGNYEK